MTIFLQSSLFKKIFKLFSTFSEPSEGICVASLLTGLYLANWLGCIFGNVVINFLNKYIYLERYLVLLSFLNVSPVSATQC